MKVWTRWLVTSVAAIQMRHPLQPTRTVRNLKPAIETIGMIVRRLVKGGERGVILLRAALYKGAALSWNVMVEGGGVDRRRRQQCHGEYRKNAGAQQPGTCEDFHLQSP